MLTIFLDLREKNIDFCRDIIFYYPKINTKQNIEKDSKC